MDQASPSPRSPSPFPPQKENTARNQSARSHLPGGQPPSRIRPSLPSGRRDKAWTSWTCRALSVSFQPTSSKAVRRDRRSPSFSSWNCINWKTNASAPSDPLYFYPHFCHTPTQIHSPSPPKSNV
jgi:hypothetical protein